ncbi:MAG TPA: hypothetical protein VMN37_12380 [Gemmatimonadales bacterium]|nr:hypothetical protein [Gemmatimonadales bacterium]
MDHEQLDEPLRQAAREYHQPGPTPREAIWLGIERGRRAGRRPRVGVRIVRRWLPLAAVAGAVLAAGVGIGRLTVQSDAGPVARAGEATADAGRAANAAYRLAALEHLSQSEEFLTLFRISLGRSEPRLASATARRLLGTNRLLLDSPAAMDRPTRLLLEDLELVLAGIAQLPEDARRQDLDLITEGMERGDVMPRLRTAVPSGAASS